MLFCWYYCAYWRGVPQKTHSFGPIAPKASRNFWISRWKSCRSRLPIITTITSWDATKRRMKKSSPKSCRHYGKRPLYPKLSAALQTAGSWSLRQRMGIPASSGLMKTGSMASAEHPMCFPATRRSGIWRGKFRKHIRNTGKRWSKKADRKSRVFLACMQLRPRKQGTPGLFIFVFQTRGSLGFGFICSLSPSTQNSTLYFRNFRIFFRAAAMDFCTA